MGAHVSGIFIGIDASDLVGIISLPEPTESNVGELRNQIRGLYIDAGEEILSHVRTEDTMTGAQFVQPLRTFGQHGRSLNTNATSRKNQASSEEFGIHMILDPIGHRNFMARIGTATRIGKYMGPAKPLKKRPKIVSCNCILITTLFLYFKRQDR